MTVTIELKNQETLNILRNMESLGLIHIREAALKDHASPQNGRPNRWLRGICKDIPEGSVKNFLAECHADKERELALEKRQEEEQGRHA